MNKMSLSAISVAVMLSLSGCASTASQTNTSATQQAEQTAAPALPFVNIDYQTFTLDNGLTVVVHTDRKAPIVAVNVWYDVGAKNEQVGKTGFAHLFEHLMFNGTENYDDEYFGPFERAGATEQNGTTNSDRTNYFQNVPTPALDMALWMESDRMGHLLGAITQDKLDEQRGVVQNEKRQGEAQPYGTMWNNVWKYTFPQGHPYSWSVIGSMEDLNAASLDDVHQWFKDYYGPNNAVLVLAGDIDVETAKKKANKYFGDIKPGKPVAKLEKWIAKRDEQSRMVIKDRVPASRIVKVWNTAEKGTTDGEYLNLLSDVLAGGKNSRLYQRLVYDEQLASNVFSFNYLRTLAGQLIIGVDALDKSNIEKIEAIIDEEIANIIAQGPTTDELNRIKFSNAAEWVKQVEGVGGFGGKSDVLASGAVYHNDPGYYKRAFEITSNATTSDVQGAAERWLSSGDFVLTVHPFAELSANEQGVDRSTGVPGAGDVPSLDLPEVNTFTLSNGLEVVLSQRSDTPVINMRLDISAGTASDDNNKPGVANFTANMLDEGAGELSALALAEELEKLGASIDTSASLDKTSLSMSAMAINWQQSLALFSEVLQNPSFNDSDIERVRTLILQQIKQEKARPMSNALRVLPPLLYGASHPYGKPLTGTGNEESVAAISRDDMLAYTEKWMRPDLARLVVVGDIDQAQLKQSLEQALASWQAPQQAAPSLDIPTVDNAEQARVFVLDKPDSPQSLIISGLLGPDANDTDAQQEVTLDMMNTIIGGSFTSRMNMNLREDKGWSYGARTILMDTDAQSTFFVFAPVQTDKTKESMQEILKELNGYIGEQPATQEELDKVVANKIAKLPGRYEKKRSLLNALADAYDNGRDVSYLEKYPQLVQQPDTQAIAKQAQSLIKPKQLTWVIVGDVAKIKEQIESLNLGEVTYLD
ncbi:M16 family metallopeptidase [Pseudoalteromonas ruthenica]|uniref:Peptidase M16 n=1 Tax=Pseudoalteromonas ruthenica TaxID=151081 RepID=A0A0F4PUP4_9GAMM|nr:pitrilysin family protein [Pseudoalteromonas ruthenica]KJY99137.1 peptidase M16 [Pseudoalteromonas ruthenica]KJY99820.1 peptidase M16 [Pseudoalteromonas ruthenica]TMO88344.1 insulinase family protein [Pseudoalteromonas ruthenica]TMO92974.1 insulinase family protein [Pseudoalteromonas ruthenica]TMP00536.1 insulinase family protein [Pseudoalteromonas ruthenica]